MHQSQDDNLTCICLWCVQSCHFFFPICLAKKSKAIFKDLPDRCKRHVVPSESLMSRLDAGILSLPRTSQVFEEMEKHQYINYDLPAKGSLPGKVLKHMYRVLDRCIEKKKAHDLQNRCNSQSSISVQQQPLWV